MKVRRHRGAGEEKIELQMTPMIDIVFQLLVFFIMTFKIVAQEGDFNIKMPISAPREGLPPEDQLPPMRLRLQADADGHLASIHLNEKAFGTRFNALRNHIISIVGEDTGPLSIRKSAEIEIDADYHLRYANIIKAITAISGFKNPDDQEIVKMIEKIKFSPPKKPPAGR